MDSKKLIMLFALAGVSLGSALPLLWGGSELSFISVLLGGIGGIAGIYVGFKVSQ
ncbi:MAG: hypothetical protein PHV93_00045 [Candidatus Pacebacteria bacterium]|nr:hypothetical protein [Candidatus Paceibacterota bacterium]